MNQFSIPRSGLAPLKFTGDLVAQARGADLWNWSPKRQPNRFHTISVYSTNNGNYVVHIKFECNTRYDDPYDKAQVFQTPAEVAAYLANFDPTQDVRGWPLERHQEQDARLRTALRNNFKLLVSQVLSQHDEFCETVT